jgi:iron(III) transport system substrate-binding protein
VTVAATGGRTALALDIGRLAADTGGGPVSLTRLEFLLLRELASHVGQPVPKRALLAAVWGYDSGPGSNVVDACVARLRSKLGFDLIQTVRGEGYQLADGLSASSTSQLLRIKLTRMHEHAGRKEGRHMGRSSRSRSRALRWLALSTGTLISASLLAACSGASAVGGGSGSTTITLYSGQHPQLTTAIVSAFEKQTGIQVKVRSDDGIVLADQILQEGSHSPADIYLTENSPELMLLTEHHLLAKLPASITSQIPAQYESPTGNWVGISVRVSALAYNPSLISSGQLPASILDLAQPKWKGKVAIAPTDSDFVPLVGAVIATYGEQAALNWLRGLKNNATQYADIESVVAAVNKGQHAVGIINQYYWYRLRTELGAGNTHSKVYYFPDHNVGGLENISGAAVLASSAHKTAAEKFVSFLVSAQAEKILAAGDTYEYPVRPGIAPSSALMPLLQVNPAILNVVSLGNDLPAAALLQQAGLT